MPADTTSSTTAADHLAWLAIQVLIAAAAFAFVGRGFVFDAGPLALSLAAYGIVALLSTGVLAASLIGLAAAAPVAFARRSPVTFLAAPTLLAALTFFVEADGIVYRLYKTHVNGMVVNLLSAPGGGDSFTLGRGTLTSAATIAATAWGFHAGVSWLLLRRIDARRGSGWARRALAVALPAAAVIVLADKSVFAWASFAGRTDLTRVRSLIPLYRPVAMNKFLHKRLGLDPAASPAGPERAGALDYPRAPLVFRSDAPRLNVVMVAVEGLRADMLDPAVMPFLARWAEGQISCADNLSSGNASRFGVFGLLYGLDGTLWRAVREEPRPPVLIAELLKRGYAFRVVSGTDLRYPEFRQTAFRLVIDAVTDSWPGERVDRDRLQTDAMDAFLDADRRPFFVFSFYDASHQPYLFPPEDEVFRPTLPQAQLDYVRLAAGHGDQVPLLFNRYRNSLRYIDREIERLVSSLTARGRLEDTIVVVAGDHGEEFGEGGFVGHNSAFDDWQLKTPLIVHLPGARPRRIDRPTSHEDVVPTILEALGVVNPPEDYSHGVPLTRETGGTLRVVADWDSAAVVGPEETVVFGTETTNLDVHVQDRRGRTLAGRESAHREDLAYVLRRMAQFRR